MEDKKLPQSETDEQNINGAVPDDDEYFSLEDVSDEVSDDDLDLSELIRKYMPDEEDPLAPSYDAPSEEISDNAEPEYYGGEDGANPEDYPESYDDVPSDGGADYDAPDEADADTIDSAVYADYADEVGADGDAGETAEYEDSTDLDYTGYDDDSDDADDADGELVYDEPAADEEYAYDGGETNADDEQYGEYGDGEPYYDENAPELDEVADVALDTDGEEDSMSDTSSQDYVNYEDGDGDIELDGDLDSTDINLMLAFGLDDELERTMGPEVAQKLTEELDEEQRVRDEKVRKTVDNEYMNRTQTAGIAADYKKKFKGLKLKIFLSVVLAAVLFFYENLRIFGFEFDGALNPAVYPVVYIMVSLQILLLLRSVRIPRDSRRYRRAVHRKDQPAVGNCGDDGGSLSFILRYCRIPLSLRKCRSCLTSRWRYRSYSPLYSSFSTPSARYSRSMLLPQSARSTSSQSFLARRRTAGIS